MNCDDDDDKHSSSGAAEGEQVCWGAARQESKLIFVKGPPQLLATSFPFPARLSPAYSRHPSQRKLPEGACLPDFAGRPRKGWFNLE